MSHAEIWDDSALVDSWNDALEEYKHYHSISARGEKVEEILKNHDNKSNGLGGQMAYEDGGVNYLLSDDPQAKENLAKETVDGASMARDENSRDGEENQGAVAGQAFGHLTSKGPEIPQQLVGQVHDEGLKNLLMAWYYAGYYTGLHEGKQQGAAGQAGSMDK